MKLSYCIVLLTALATLVVTTAPVLASELDEQIESSAMDLYVFKTYLKNDEITITSRDGVVTLTGTVSEEPSRLLAQETILNMPGVTSVDNKLEIKGEKLVEKSDAWISAHVKTILIFHRSVSGINTEVSVKDSVVTLRGEAINLAQKQLTTQYARDVDGVKDVKNEMTVAAVPKAEKETIGEKIDDASITAQIKMSLLFHRSTSMLKTTVKSENGVVTVSGMAKNAAEKDLVTKLIGDIHGVTEVNNRMTVEESK